MIKSSHATTIMSIFGSNFTTTGHASTDTTTGHVATTTSTKLFPSLFHDCHSSNVPKLSCQWVHPTCIHHHELVLLGDQVGASFGLIGPCLTLL
jgi:hypothetical protein